MDEAAALVAQGWGIKRAARAYRVIKGHLQLRMEWEWDSDGSE
jgi:hypothetical protein